MPWSCCNLELNCADSLVTMRFRRRSRHTSRRSATIRTLYRSCRSPAGTVTTCWRAVQRCRGSRAGRWQRPTRRSTRAWQSWIRWTTLTHQNVHLTSHCDCHCRTSTRLEVSSRVKWIRCVIYFWRKLWQVELSQSILLRLGSECLCWTVLMLFNLSLWALYYRVMRTEKLYKLWIKCLLYCSEC